MTKNNRREIFLVYDYFSADSIIPNGLNYRYLQKYIQNSFDMDNMPYNEIEEIYEDPIAVWNGDNLLHDVFNGFTSINNVSRKKLNTIYLYSVCPYGGAQSAFGEKNRLNEGYSFFNFISSKSLEYIKTNENYFLFINYTNEGIIDYKWFDTIYSEIERLDIPHNKIIFAISDFNIETNFNIWYSKNGKNKGKINVVYFNWSRPTKAKEYLAILNNTKTKSNPHANGRSIVTKNKIRKNTKRPYKFLNFNRRIRNHRLYTILYFYHKNIINDVLISYDFTDEKCVGFCDTSVDVGQWIHPLNLDNDQIIYLGNIKNIINKILNEVPKKTIDYENIGDVSGLNFENDKPFLDSYIHIISETNFFDIGGYFSEKTWKPIGNLQPFIMMGPHNSLEELKKLGFKTFYPFINEDYDKIENNEIRFVTVLNEIYRLSTLSKEEIHKWYNSISDVLEHNQKLLLSSKSLNVYYKDLRSKINEIYENNTFG
jgi:hypothetical protein